MQKTPNNAGKCGKSGIMRKNAGFVIVNTALDML